MARAFILLVVGLLMATSMASPVSAAHEYVLPVWFTWSKVELNVLVLGVNDPIVGNAIRVGIERWEVGIERHAVSWLADALVLRVYNPALDPEPPEGWTQNIDIVVVPQGFMAVRSGAKCVAMAPMLIGWGNMVKVVMHEFGHCLGLGHIFNHGVEYSPNFDPMGGATSGLPPCPSNLNLKVLERVFGGQFGHPIGGSVTMSAADYTQPSCT